MIYSPEATPVSTLEGSIRPELPVRVIYLKLRNQSSVTAYKMFVLKFLPPVELPTRNVQSVHWRHMT